jgi:hypothetical protein
VDVNDDGLMDVLSGSYSRMEGTMAGLFQVLYGLPEGSFERARPLLGTDGEPLVLTAGEGPIPRDPQQDPHLIDRICTRPSACDLDGDGNLDLVVGNFRGTFHVFRGRGAGKFAPRSIELLDIEGQPLAVSAHGDPWPVDWDGDGDLDLLSGSGQGGVSWAENRGTAKAPRFAAFRELIAPSATGSDDVERDDSHLVGPEQSTRVTAADADGDGVLDLLVGDTVTVVVSADGVDLEVAREQWRLYRTRSQAAWEAYSAVSDEAGEDDERTRAALDLYRERESELREVCDRFVDERRTGHVWFYRGRTAPVPDAGDGSGAPPPGADR